MQEVRIKIPKAQENEIANILSGDLGVSPKEAKRRFEKIDNLLFGIIASVVISGIAVVIAVVGLFLDQMRYNNAAYKEYSQKTESIETIQKTNEILLNQNQESVGQNTQNQELILKQQGQIIELLKKK
jgi:predicted PurR-regulated permease PerM